MNLKDDKLKKMLQEFTDKNLEQSVNTNGVVVVDFWAEWCGPCRVMGPIIEELAMEIPGVKIGKLNVDENPNSAITYQVSSIPTIIIFKGGSEIERIVGTSTKQSLYSKITTLNSNI